MKAQDARLLMADLPIHFGGSKLGAGLYARNLYRIVGASVADDRDTVRQKMARVQSVLRFGSERALRHQVSVGYASDLPAQVIADVLNEHAEPYIRLLNMALWPHLPLSEIIDDSVPPRLNARKSEGGSLSPDLVAHAQAVALQNQSIAGDLDALGGEPTKLGPGWTQTFDAWRRVLVSPVYWASVQTAAENWDAAEHLDELKIRLPEVLLETAGVLADWRYESGDEQGSFETIETIAKSGFPSVAIGAVLRRRLQNLGSLKLARLARQIAEAMPAKENRLDYRQFHRVVAPVVADAIQVLHQIQKQVGADPTDLVSVDCSAFCDVVVSSTLRRLDYSGDDWPRAFHTSYMLVQTLLDLPLSAIDRSRASAAMKGDRKHLYGDLLAGRPSTDLDACDPSACWFCPGEPAHPEASIVLPVHKVTGRTSRNVSFKSDRVLVPRSIYAREHHLGRAATPSTPKASAAEGPTKSGAPSAGQRWSLRNLFGSKTRPPTVKPESAASDFPIYIAARRNGFSEGAKPSL